MMTGIKRLAAVFAAFSALVSCVSEAEDPDTVSNAREWAFIASLDGNDSRTLVKEDNKIWWSPSDSIRIFYGSQASGKFRSSNDNAVAVTKFTGTFDSAIGGIETGQNPLSFWGVYPYSEESVCDDASVTLRFPTEQEAVEGSFAPGAFPTVAKSDNLSLSFWIVGGGVRFTVERTGIRRAVFRSADGSPVSGVARVSFDDYGLPVVTDVSAPVDSVVVLAPKSGFVPGKAYFATMLPVTHKNGLRISVKTATTRGNGVLAKEISVRRAVFGRLDKIDSGLEYISDMPVPEMVDLGLSVKWASFNLGAEAPEEYGEYFAWGETEPKADYSWSTYKWCYNGSLSKLTKYCTNANYGYNGFVDNKTVLDPEDDAATANLGGKWRMPTEAEQHELLNNCTWEWTTLNGVNGRKVTSKKEAYTEKWIFLPAAGERDGSSLYNAGSSGYYWSSFLNSDKPYLCTYSLWFRSVNMGWSNSDRYFGRSVRPVYGDVVHVNGISLDKTEATLPAGATLQLTATLTPENAPDNRISWSSSDKSVATVSSDGLVTAIALGASEITATTNDGGFKAVCSVVVAYQVSVPEMVDLGLSVKWASFNLGATKAEESGDYFAWGETEPKANYSWSTYKWCYNGSSSKLTKYCTDASYGYNGFVDDKGVLDPEDDAATANLGGKWRMPTYNEWRELINNCSWTSATLGDVKGVKIMQASTGNWIFLPFTGYCSGKSAYSNYSFYLASSKYLLNQTNARGLYMDSSLSEGMSYYSRIIGYSIRPVYGDFIHVTNISLDKSKLSLTIGGSGKLTAFAVPENASEPAVIWKSSDESIATVNEGVVTGVAAGTATITVKSADGGCFATCTVSVSNRVYVPEAVDLGLPSGLKWASFNLMASAPEEVGAYYAWGETEPKVNYSWSTYKWCKGSNKTMTKYCTESAYGNNGYTDDKGFLYADDDAASVLLGGDWRMPTSAEWQELWNNCNRTSTTVNGVTGYKLSGKKDGYTDKSIFLPAAGYKTGTSISEASYMFYWSKSLYSLEPYYALGLRYTSYSSSGSRSSGFLVRAVKGDWIPVTGISLDKSSATLTTGGTVKLSAALTPSTASETGVIWRSSNESIATASDGAVTGVAPGTATITAKSADGGYTATCNVSVNSRVYVPEAVDLGLPSGLKWASFNLMASAPEEFGAYYAWGETEPKSGSYSWSTYKWCYNGSEIKLTKYCYDSAYGNNGYADNKGVLEAEDDAAAVALGGKWRIPTYSDYLELAANCSSTSVTINGVSGTKYTSKVQGYTDKWIFLPSAGYKESAIWSSGFHYQTSILSLSHDSRYCNLTSGGGYYRSYGRSIRPVYGDFIPVSSISFVKNSVVLSPGSSAQIPVSVSPSNASEKSVIWQSSDKSVVTVSNGIVTAVSIGTGTVTARSIDGGFTATCQIQVVNTIPVPEAVDLGLSVKWASFNLGASCPEQYGNYYAWGETAPKAKYNWSTYKWCKGSATSMTKYCNNSSYGYNGFTDGKTVLDPEDDAAAVALGGSWRMPTKAEQDELRNDCTWTWTTINGVYGRKVTSKKAGYTDKWIFLPAAGYPGGTSLRSAGSGGYYWSSSLNSGDPSYASYVHFSSDHVGWFSSCRDDAQSVRPVSE